MRKESGRASEYNAGPVFSGQFYSASNGSPYEAGTPFYFDDTYLYMQYIHGIWDNTRHDNGTYIFFQDSIHAGIQILETHMVDNAIYFPHTSFQPSRGGTV